MTKVNFLLSASVLVTATCAFGALAQDTGDGSGDRHDHPLRDDALVVTGSGLEILNDEALQPSDVFSFEALQEAHPGSLGDVLDVVPGVSTTYFGPAASRPLIRGLGGDRVRVLRNGVGLIDASAASVDHAVTSDLLEAERVEILRGPAAIAYGGNAVGGVVNIVDAAIASELLDTPFEGATRAGYTSVDGGTQAAARVRAGAGPFVFSLEGSRRDADNFDIPGFAESAAYIAAEEAEEAAHAGDAHAHEEEEEEAFGTVENTDFTFETLGAGASIIGDWGYAGLSLKVYAGEYGLPGGHEHGHEEEHGHETHADEPHAEEEEEIDIYEGPRLDMSQVRVDTRGEYLAQVLGFDALTYSAGYAAYEHEEIEPNGEVATSYENEGFELRVAAVRRGDGPLTGTVGLQSSFTDFSALGEEAFIPPVVTKDTGVFAAGRYDLDGFGFEGGIRFERRDLEAVDGDLSRLPEENVEAKAFLDGFNPDTDLRAALMERDYDLFSVSAGAFLRPADNVFLSANLSRAERAPSDVELFAGGPHLATNAFEVGDPRLGKETATGLDLAARFDTETMSVNAGIFATQFDDYIYLGATDMEADELPVFVFSQDDAMFWGLEVGLDTQLVATDYGLFTGDVALEYVAGEGDEAGNLPRIPPFTATFGVNWDWASWGVRGEVIAAADQENLAAYELPTGGYTLVNLSAKWSPFDDKDVRLLFGVRNLTDEEARLHTSFLKDQVPLAGRSYTVAIATTF